MSELKPAIQLTQLGAPDGAVCIDGVCEIPGAPAETATPAR